MSPLFLPCSGTPLPLICKISPVFIPSGILSLESPSRVWMSYSAPSKASESLISKFITKSSPSFLNILCFFTCVLIYKSPAWPPFTASPAPERRIISPLSIPVGIFIFISSSCFKIPEPLQKSHFSLGTLPEPPHVSQVRLTSTDPKIDLFISLNLPLPLHVLQSV